MAATEFAIVGAGWRSEFFLKVAQELPELFHVCIVVEPDSKRAEYIQKKWGVLIVSNMDEIKAKAAPEFLVLCLPSGILPDMTKQATDKGFHVLTETFAAESTEAIEEYYRSVKNSALIQISEQYWFHPVHTARLNLIHSGVLGEVSQAQISVGHGYHGISLLRKYLGVGFDNCRITGKYFKNKIVKGPGRAGYPEKEEIVENCQQFAVFDFGDKWGVFDFTEEQYFSGIRKPRILIRGERGELSNNEVRYLLDYKTPVEYGLYRIASGTDGSMEPPHIVGITAADKWYYKNPYGDARLSDDEIAVATVMEKMSRYVKGGEAFYSLEEGCQDQYLALMMKQAMETEKSVETQTQIWRKN